MFDPDTVVALAGGSPIDPDTAGGSCHLVCGGERHVARTTRHVRVGGSPIDPDTAGGSCHVPFATTYQVPPFLMASTVSPSRTFFTVEYRRASRAYPSMTSITRPPAETLVTVPLNVWSP